MQLSQITIITGVVLSCFHLALIVMPQRAGGWLERFPRHVGAGRVLATLAAGWTVWLLLHANINWVDEHRRFVYLMAPAAWLLVVFFMDDLLAVRALGGLLLLAPMPILDAAFFEPSPWRLVMVVFAYILVIKGMALVWSPYLFRKQIARWMPTPGRLRAAGMTGMFFSLFLMGLGWFTY